MKCQNCEGRGRVEKWPGIEPIIWRQCAYCKGTGVDARQDPREVWHNATLEQICKAVVPGWKVDGK